MNYTIYWVRHAESTANQDSRNITDKPQATHTE